MKRTKRFKRVGAVVVPTAIVAVLLTSCAGGGSSASTGASAANTINVMVAEYSDTTTAEWKQIVKDFEAKNPGITVHLSVESWTNIANVVTTDIQSGKAPDVLNYNDFSGYQSDGLLYPAKELVSPQVFSDFQTSFDENASNDGTQWGVPFLASSRAMYYNKDIFAKAGISSPPKTWAQLETDAKKIRAIGSIGIGIPLGNESADAEAGYFFYGAGGGYGDDQKLTVDTPQNLEGATEIQKLIEGGLTEPNAGATQRDDLLNVFVQGQIGMEMGLPQTVVQIKEKNPSLKYGVAPIPTKDGSSFTLGAEDYFMAFKNKVDKKPAITKFLDYVYTPSIYVKWLSAEGFLPVTKSGDKLMASNVELKPFVVALPSAKFLPVTNPKWTAVVAALETQLGELAQGSNPSDVLKAIQAKAGQ